MKNHSLIIFVSAVLMLASATAAASPSDDAYYAEMEKMAAEADIAETVSAQESTPIFHT
ncbi:hypothetical protein [Thiolapillus sp.]|uniref:hypothetical protein n=1 Tax=Thiolapillus sp. TaxID=2017437 RepID=UPI0025F6A42C|nr:hypothetical protein [Thiolapillus sp.]